MPAIGRRIYGLGAIGLGIVELRYGSFSGDWLPLSSHTPGYAGLVYAAAGLLIAGGLAINLPRAAAIGSLVVAAVFAGVVIGVHLPNAMGKPAVWGVWQAVAEGTGMGLGGVLAFGLTPGLSDRRAAAIARVARPLFGICLLIFGVSHFVYAKLTASMVPAWLPPSQLIWAYVTGAAQFAAGLAVISGVQARLAAILLAVMYAAFGLLVHLPSVIADPSSHDNWVENAVNFLLLGAAWCLVDQLSRSTRRPG